MALSGSLTNITPLGVQEYRLCIDFDSVAQLLAFRELLKSNADYSDVYALVDDLIEKARRDIESEGVEANVPGVPTNIEILEDEFVIWDDMEFANKYEVELNGNVTEVSHPSVAYDPQDGETYQVRVRAGSDSGWSLWSDMVERTFTPDQVVMGTPERYQLEVRFPWAAVYGATGYRVYGAFSPGVDRNSNYVDVVDPLYVRELNPGQTLYVRVSAMNDGGLGIMSDEVSMEVPEA